AQVYDIGSAEGQYYLAMEYLQGADVAKIVRTLRQQGARLPLEQALLIVSSICAGLHYAHERRDAQGRWLRIVHRDVSPHNVFVTFEGMCKLVDFGIAKASHSMASTHTGT